MSAQTLQNFNSKTFSRIEVIFLPENTTSRLHPIDAAAGITKNFKVQYQKLLVTHTLAQIDGSSLTASEITRSVHILTAMSDESQGRNSCELFQTLWNAGNCC